MTHLNISAALLCFTLLAIQSWSHVLANECSGPLSKKGRCHHGSFCQSGPSDYGDLLSPFADTIPFLAETDVDGEHCQCDLDDSPIEGHTGVSCEHKFEVCDPKHSGFACFHGSTCTKIEKHKYWCDCSTAKWDGYRHNFVGMQCEYGGPKDDTVEICPLPSVPAALEEADEELGQWFCLNGGKCHESKHIDKKCKCSTGYKGVHCEYLSSNEDVKVEEDCTLQCSNGGQCKHGLKDYGKHAEQAEQKELDPQSDPNGLAVILENLGSHEELMHCVCGEGWTGLRCDIKVEECENSNDGTTFYCYNGSKCAKEKLEDGTKRHYCDCSTAHEAEKSYAGEFCQYASTTFCDPPEGMKESLSFCTNRGVCPAKAHEPCLCPPGFTGHQCESRGFVPSPCNLKCKNGGACRVGNKNYGHLANKFNLPFHNKGHVNFEHCVCPDGYTGVDCSVPLEVCGDMDHVCTNGSQCVKKGDRWGCDCNAGQFRNKKVAGFYCEHQAENSCTTANTADSFCVNGGTCVGIVSPTSPHPGCLCLPEFDGPHCEFHKSIASAAAAFSNAEPETTEKSRKAAILFSFMVIVIGMIAFVAVLAVRRYASPNEKEIDTADAVNDTFQSESRNGQSVPRQESVDLDELEMTDVEII